ncbi:MAG: hypothetical protein GVY36_07045 [Verrucomicrobia bacterium]|jgi:hypothetical protein|nr:hypothetical protein [Verrucomicrobiota bacterium]
MHLLKNLFAVGVLLATLPAQAQELPTTIRSINQTDLPDGVHISTTGTNRTTGHVGDLKVTNDTFRTVFVDLDPMYVPPVDAYQGYVTLPGTRGFVLPLNEEAFPIKGFCTDVGKPPVPGGVEIPVGYPFRPGDGGAASGKGGRLGDATRGSAGPGDEQSDTGVSSVPPLSDGGLSPLDPRPALRGPSHAKPFDPTETPERATGVFVPVLMEIVRAYDRIEESEPIKIAIPMPEDERRESLIQQTFWLYTSLVDERQEPYTKEDLQNRLEAQIEKNTGAVIAELPERQQEQIEEGTESIWDNVVLVGTEAKVLRENAPAGGEPVPGLRERVPPSEQQTGGPGGGSTVVQQKDCVHEAELPPINDFDLYQQLYERGLISFDPQGLIDDLELQLQQAKAAQESLANAISLYAECCPGIAAAGSIGDDPTFPELVPDFYFAADLCNIDPGKNQLADYVSDFGLENIDNWAKEIAAAFMDLGLDSEAQPNLSAYISQQTQNSLDVINNSTERFKLSMSVFQELAFNENEQWSEAFQAAGWVVTGAIAAATGGVGGVALAAAMEAAGAITETAMVDNGFDPETAKLAGSLVSMSGGMGVGKATGKTFGSLLEGATYGTLTGAATGVPGGLIEKDLAADNAAIKNKLANLGAAATLACDDTWAEFRQSLVDATYDVTAINRLESYNGLAMDGEPYMSRNYLKTIVCNQAQKLQRFKNTLGKAIPAMEAALEAIKAKMDPGNLARQIEAGLAGALPCCCKYEDGSLNDCSVRFGF